MNRYIIAFAAFSAVFTASPVFAFLKVGESAELFVTGDASAEFRDNLFLSNSGAKSDSILDLTPGLLYTYGAGAMVGGEIGAQETFRFYQDNDGLNTELANIWANIGFNDGKTTVKADGSFKQFDQASIDVRGLGFLVKRDVTHAEVNSDLDLTEKTVLGVGLGYDNTDYKRAGYADWQWWELPVHFYYKTFPKLELGGGVTYRKNDLSGVGLDSDEIFYNFRARGELTAKLTTDFTIGLSDRSPDVGSRQRTLGLKSRFDYGFSEKTHLYVSVGNGFGYSGTGSQYRKGTVDGGVNIAFTEAFRAGADVNYGHYNYIGTSQVDDFWTYGVNGEYLINAFLSVTGRYTYTSNDSNLPGSGFKDHSFRVGAKFKY